MPSPTEPLIVQSVNRFRAALLAAERESATRLVQSYGTIYERLQTLIRALEADITDLGEAATPGRVAKLARYKELMRQTAAEMDRFAVILENEVTQMRVLAARQATEQAASLMQMALPSMPDAARASIAAKFNRLPVEAVMNMLGQTAAGSPLTAIFEGYGAQAAQAMSEALLEGIALGYNPRKVAAMILQSLGGDLTRALAISRTEVMRAYRAATLASYRANSDVVKGWIWTVTKDTDPPPCLACLALDGQEFPLTEEFMPSHVNCRCSPRPRTITYREMGIDADDPPDGYETAAQWFESLPEIEQQKFFGKAAWEAYKNGEVKLTDFIGVQESAVWGKAYVERSLKDILGK